MCPYARQCCNVVSVHTRSQYIQHTGPTLLTTQQIQRDTSQLGAYNIKLEQEAVTSRDTVNVTQGHAPMVTLPLHLWPVTNLICL